MMMPRHTLLLVILAALLLSACALSRFGPVPLQPTNDAGANQIRTQAVATALAGLTAQPRRSSTPVEQTTPTPTSTVTPQPPAFTPTASPAPTRPAETQPAVIEYPTRTPTPSQTDYRCSIQEIEPEAAKKITVDADFDLVVRLKNTGELAWNPGKILFVYTSGEKMQSRTSAAVLTTQVDVDGEINFTVDMHAPDNPGVYKTTWALMSGPTYFCPVHFQVVVTKN